MLMKLIFLFFLSVSIQASSVDTSNTDLWLTGPLITGSAQVVPTGHINVQPYLFSIVNTGFYNRKSQAKGTIKSFQINPQVLIKGGIAKNFDCSMILQSFYNRREQSENSQFGDIPVSLSYQLYEGKNRTFVRTALQIIIPTGKFHGLQPEYNSTDVSGGGSIFPMLSFGFSRLYHITGAQYFRPRFTIGYAFGTPFNVKGRNLFGGGPGTKGKIYPGDNLNYSLGMEYTLTKLWALAFDISGQFVQKTHFKGRTILPCGRPSSMQLTLAPAIEYNWSNAMGLILGSWFTVAGRNNARFYSVAAAYNYYF